MELNLPHQVASRLEDQKVIENPRASQGPPHSGRQWLPALILLKDMEEIPAGDVESRKCCAGSNSFDVVDSTAFHVEVHAFEWRSSVWYCQIDLTLRDVLKILTQKKGRINLFDILCFLQICHFSGWCFMLHLKLHIDLLVSAAAFAGAHPGSWCSGMWLPVTWNFGDGLGVAEIWNHVSAFTITYYCMWLCIYI